MQKIIHHRITECIQCRYNVVHLVYLRISTIHHWVVRAALSLNPIHVLKQTKILEVWGKAQREATQCCKSDWKSLSP